MTIQRLTGLRPLPLGSYLAGLGLIRVLGQQADRDLTAWWSDSLVLETNVDDIARWLVESYRPTPVLSPWNKDGVPQPTLEKLCALPTSRLDPLRSAVEVVERSRAELGPDASKHALVPYLRRSCPPEMLPWVDAAVVTTGEKTVFPPLLGTGGNDGRLEIARTFLGLLLLVMEPGARTRSRALGWAHDMINDTLSQKLHSASVGQFDPGSAGGKNSSPFGSAESLVNPWIYLLMIEGATLFAVSEAGRLVARETRAAIPFTVDASVQASASGAEDETTRGEVWAPLWNEPFTAAEVQELFREARASWRGRPARRAVDFYRACVTHGVAQGVSAFQRFGLHERNGRGYVAVPLDEVRVQDRPEVALAEPLDNWVLRIPTNTTTSPAPASIRRAARSYEAAQIALARRGGPLELRDLLAARTSVELSVAHSGDMRAKLRPDTDRLPADRLIRVLAAQLRDLPNADDEALALRIATGLASARRRQEPPLRHLLLPIDANGRAWTDSAIVNGYGVRPLRTVLADVLAWRSRTVPARPTNGDRRRRSASVRGVAPLTVGVPVPDADLHRWVSSSGARLVHLDKKIGIWLAAMLALDWSRAEFTWPNSHGLTVLYPTLAYLTALAAGLTPRHDSNEPGTGLDPTWARRLTAGQLGPVHKESVQRLRRAGRNLATPSCLLRHVDRTTHGTTLAAALTVRCDLPTRALGRIAPVPTANPTAALTT